MKRLYTLVRCIVIVVAGFHSAKGLSQCQVDYTTANYFCDLDSLLLTAVPLSGEAPFSFIWETGETTQTIMIPLAYGDYMVTMTDANGCTVAINCHIKPYPQVLYYPYNQNACAGDVVTLYLEWFRDSIPGATYLWSTGETTPTITLTDDLVWSVTVTDPSTGCEFIIPEGLFDFHEVNQPEIVGPEMICPGNTVTLTVEGGPFGYVVWYMEGSWESFYGNSFEVTQPGTYYVWGNSVTADYCWKQDTIVILPGDIPPPVLEGPPNLCEGQSGQITITNASDYVSYQWGNGETGPFIDVSEPGVYFVTVTDDGGCTAMGSLSILDDPGPTLETDPAAASCGQSDGGIDLEVSPPLTMTYAWSNGAGTEDLDNIPPGSYTVTVTDDEGCTSVITEEVPDEPIDIVITETITPNTSCTNFNGAIDLNITPTNQPYTYIWSNGATTQDLANLLAGTYSVTVTTGVNCQVTGEFEVQNFSGAAEIWPVEVPASCGLSNGSITINLEGGQGPFQFLWSNGYTTESLTDIPAGAYSVTVTGADGCVNTEVIQLLSEDPEISIAGSVTPNSSCSDSNGEIDITVNPEESYEYSWSNGAITEDLINLSAGTYMVTVTLGISCVETGSFTVLNENIPFSITGTSMDNSSCSVPNGSIDLDISPDGGYLFQWASGETSEDLSGLNEGNYTVTVTNSEGCAISSTFTINNTASQFNISGLTIHNTSCQAPNGEINISIEPAGTYTYIWSNGATTEDLQNINAGNYSVTVTNADGCAADTSFTITDDNSAFAITNSMLPNTSCGIATGSIDISITPAGSYSFLWSDGSTTEDLSGVMEGFYGVTVTDGNGCSTTSSIEVESSLEYPEISAVTTPESCGMSDGTIDVSVNMPGSTFNWSNGSTDEDLMNLPSGQFIVTVTNSQGCSIVDTIQVGSSSNSFSINSSTTDNSSCAIPTGSIDLNVVPSGVYTFIWSNGETSEDLASLNAGSYTVTVTDPLGCTNTSTFNIGSTMEVPAISFTSDPSTCGAANGAIDISVTPAGLYSFSWSEGSTSEDLQNVGPGNYSLIVTGANGCTAEASITVEDENSNFIVTGSSINNNACVAHSGNIDITVVPSGSYIYQWSTGETTEDIASIPGGNYFVTITDPFGCSSIDSFTIEDESVLPEISTTVQPASCGQPNGSVDVFVLPSGSYTYNWSDGSSTEDLQNVMPGSYSITATDMSGCSAVANVEVMNLNTNFSVTIESINNTSCELPNGSASVITNPAGPYTFVWSNGATVQTIDQLASGIYSVTVSDTFNCSTTQEVIVEDETSFPLIAEVIQQASCGQNNARIDLTVTPGGENQFEWSNGATTEDLHNIGAGVYSVTVTTVNGCTNYGNYTVDETTPLALDLEADLAVISQGSMVTCSLEINVPLSTIELITWSPYEAMSCGGPLCLEQTFMINESMDVAVEVVDTNGCVAATSLFLTIDEEPIIYIPNVFTPNHDGPNDHFTIYGNNQVEQIVEMEIFDRWGNCVFIEENFPPNDPTYGWKGDFKGVDMDPAVFAYRAIVRFDNGLEKAYKGDVTLIR